MLSCIKKESPDFAFSFNYYPLVSKVCQKAGLKYVSWVYDNPQVALYHYTLANSCNEVFLFDSEMYETYPVGSRNNVRVRRIISSMFQTSQKTPYLTSCIELIPSKADDTPYLIISLLYFSKYTINALCFSSS